jgi:hypothetical protein
VDALVMQTVEKGLPAMEHVNGSGAEQPQGEGFPYGIDPRTYGLSQLEYQRQLDHHRRMEHHDVMHEQHDRHMKAMEWNRAEQDRIAAIEEERAWWLRPLCEACKWFGGAFWLVVWYFLITGFLAWISLSAIKADLATMQKCLDDPAKCADTVKAGPKLR